MEKSGADGCGNSQENDGFQRDCTEIRNPQDEFKKNKRC
jgi:hypothetical protein